MLRLGKILCLILARKIIRSIAVIILEAGHIAGKDWGTFSVPGHTASNLCKTNSFRLRRPHGGTRVIANVSKSVHGLDEILKTPPCLL